MTRVGVNLLWLVPSVVGGTEDGTVSLLHAFADARDAGSITDLDVVLFGLEPLGRAHPDLLERFEHELLAQSGESRPRRVLAETVWLPRRLRAARVDVVHHAGGVVPLGGRRASGARVVLTVHDVQALELPEFFAPVKRRYLQAMLPRSVRTADVVLASTDEAGRTISKQLRVPPAKIHISPFGRPHRIDPWPDARELAATRERYHVPGPYFLYPAITYPHKNHAVLVEGFAALAGELRAEGCEAAHLPVLVLSGAPDSEEDAVLAAIDEAGIAGQVRRVGRIPRRDLDVLLTDAVALAFPSRYEGFGLPALEAMAAGCPLIAADAGAVPEVVGDGGILVSPDAPHQWTRAMRKLLDDPAARQALRERGLRRAAAERFTPARAAADLAAAYRDAAGSGRGPQRGQGEAARS